MGTAKEHFLKDKEATGKLNACTHADWFQHALILVSADLSDAGATAEEMRGVRKFKELLLSFADPEESLAAYPSTGLDHNLDNPRQDPEPVKKK